MQAEMQSWPARIFFLFLKSSVLWSVVFFFFFYIQLCYTGQCLEDTSLRAVKGQEFVLLVWLLKPAAFILKFHNSIFALLWSFLFCLFLFCCFNCFHSDFVDVPPHYNIYTVIFFILDFIFVTSLYSGL